MNMQDESLKSTGPTCGDGGMLPRFLPTPTTVDRKSRKAMTASRGNARRQGGGNSSTPGLEQVVELMEGQLPSEMRDVELAPAAKAWKTGALTSSVAVSLASRYRLREDRKALPMSDGCGTKCSEFARYSARDGYWRKTCRGYSQQVMFEENSSERWCQTWPRSLLIVAEAGCEAIAYRLPTLGPRISGTGCLLLPTPNKWDGERGADAREREGSGGPNLLHAVKMYPTPTDVSKGGGSSRSGDRIDEIPTLQGMARKGMWPTPQARDHFPPHTPEAIAKQKEAGHGCSNLNDVTGGQLNPTWVEWLMGFPLGWTDLDAWAMLWFLP